MTEETKTAFEAVAEETFDKILDLEVGSEEWCKAVHGAAELGKVYIDEAIELRKIEQEQEKLELERKKAMWDKVKLGIETATVVVVMLWTSAETRKGYEFEKTGTVTSNTFKRILNGMRTPKVL